MALDTAADRIAVQAALPRWIVNSWTQEQDLGISRHGFADNRACLACLYLPSEKSRNEHEILADQLRLPEAAIEIRTLLQTNQPVDAAFVQRVANKFEVPVEALAEFVGQPVRAFYQRALCGGLMMRLTNGSAQSTATVPMAGGALVCATKPSGRLQQPRRRRTGAFWTLPARSPQGPRWAAM